MGDERVTCVVAAHNSEAWIREAIDSILAQTHPPFEVVVVSSGSADATATIAASYPDPVRVVEIEDLGPPATRNRGVVEARGAFVAFLDADDIWLPEKLAIQLAALRTNPALGGCVTYAQPFWVDELAAEADHYREHPRSGPIPGWATITLLARRPVFDLVGPLREDLWYADSTDWFLRARAAGVEIELLPDALVRHRMRSGNLTRLGVDESRVEYLALLRRRMAGGSRERGE